MSDNTPIIELKNVEVTFTSRTGSLFKPNKVHAVRGVNMRIERGQTLGIVGESGCGKSTTCLLYTSPRGTLFPGVLCICARLPLLSWACLLYTSRCV